MTSKRYVHFKMKNYLTILEKNALIIAIKIIKNHDLYINYYVLIKLIFHKS